MNGRTASRTRSLILLAVLVVVGFACVARLGYWQILNHDVLAARARGERLPVGGCALAKTKVRTPF